MYLVVLFYSFIVISYSLHTKSHGYGYLDYDSLMCWIMWPISTQYVQWLNNILHKKKIKKNYTILYIINKIIMKNEDPMVGHDWLFEV